MGWMDVTVAILIMINAIKGWTKGFILTILHMAGFIVAWIVANTYYKTLSMYIVTNSSILPTVQSLLEKKLKKSSQGQDLIGPVATDYNIFEGLKLPKAIQEFMKSDNVIMDYGTRAVEGIYQYMAETFAKMFIDLISFFIIFLAVKLVLAIIAQVLNGIGRLPILREFNHIGGGLVGGIKGVFIVFIVLALLMPFVALTDNQVIVEGLEKSILAQYMYDHNPIISILKGDVSSNIGI